MKNYFAHVTRLITFSLISLCISCSEVKVSPVATNASRSARTSSYTAREFFNDIQQTAINQGYNVGGSEGLYAESSGQAAFDEMALASDVSSVTRAATSQIRDTSGNIWQFYTPSPASVKDFLAAGVTVKKSLEWSTRPNGTPRSQKKLRFTQD